MIPHAELMELVAAERYGDIENELQGATSAEVYALWQDAAYLRERARFFLADRHGVTLP